MSPLFRILACLLIWATAAMGEPVAVRSGSHDGFTRLVFYLPSGTEWSLEESAGSAVLTTVPPAMFDLSSVFDRIARDRLKDIRAGAAPGRIILDLACNCQLRSEVLVGNALVLDLVDRTGGQTAVAGQSPQAAPSAATPPLPGHETIATARRLTGALTLPMDRDDSAALIARSRQLAEVESEILQQVARASTQGLLIPQQPRPVAPPHSDVPVDTDPPAVRAEPREPPSALTHTALTEAADHGLRLTADGLSCLPDAELDLAAWAGDTGFAAGLGRLRAALTGEFDRTDGAVARDMARFYLAHGFGAEALNALALAGEVTAEAEILASIARILERGHDPLPSPFAGQEDCDTAAALWSVLAAPALAPGAAPEGPAILRGLNALPREIRDHIGTLLAERFVDADMPEMSRAVLRILDRDGSGPEERQQLVAARLELDQGDAEAAREVVEETAEKDREPSPEALIALVAHDLERGQPVTPEIAELAGAYVFQYRSAPIAPTLRETEILARASAGQAGIAFDLLADGEGGNLLGPGADDLRSRISIFLAAHPDEMIFLRLGLDQVAQHLNRLTPAARIAVAGRFLDLGFPEVAMDALADLTEENARLLRARAALDLGRPRRALDDLAEMAGEAAERLRAEALAATGDHGRASQVFGALELVEQSDRQAFLAGAWADLQSSGDNLNTALATLMQESPVDASPEPGELARDRRLLQDSVAARATIEGLLARHAVPSQPTN